MKKQMAAMAMTLVMATGALAGCGKTVTTTTGSSTSTEQAGSETASTETAAASSNEAAATTEAPKEGVITAQVVDIDLTSEEYAFGVDKNQPELLEKTNEYIAKIMADGTFDEICMKYFGDGTPTPVVSAVEDPSKDQLLVATNAAFEPFEYMEGENYLGIDMEIAAGLAEYLGKELVIQNMNFDSVILSVGQGKSDIAMSGLTIKPEREEHVTFTDSYYTASQKLITRSDNKEFEGCTDAASVEAILNTKDSSVKVGVQNGTTGALYCEGDAEWEFAGYGMTCVGYANGALAVQDLLNNNLDYVVIDAAPAEFITKSINAVQ